MTPDVKPQRGAKVMVLSTLHQYHEELRVYDYSTLRQIIVALSPDVLLLEVTAENLRARAAENVKREYPAVVYPLLDEFGFPAHPLEPSGASRQAWIARSQDAEKQFCESQHYKAVRTMVESWWSDLSSSWRTAADANSARTDAAVRVKHDKQDSLYPADQALVWEEWNLHFHDRIVSVLAETRAGFALVLVGLEHSYWLRARLAQHPGVDLLDAETDLRDLHDRGYLPSPAQSIP